MDERLADLLGEICLAAQQAIDYTSAVTFDEFQTDIMRQQAVTMCFLIIGEAAAKLMANYPDFVADHEALPWGNMRGLRNRIAHGYFKLKLDYVWNAAKQDLPQVLSALCKADIGTR